MDTIDEQLLTILQSNARTSNADIARRVGLAPSAIHQRLRKLEERGVVEGYAARVRPESVGCGLLAFVFLRTDETLGSFAAAEAVAALPEVLEVHDIAGEDCYLVKVRVRDTSALHALLRERIGAIPLVRSTRSVIVLKTILESSELAVKGSATRGLSAK